MTLETSLHAFRLQVTARAQALRTVSQACREFAVSRTLFYRRQRRYLAYGPDGLHSERPGPRRGRPHTLSVEAERAILALALAWPTWASARFGAQLARPDYGGRHLAPSTIYWYRRRIGLTTRRQRLAVLETHSAQAAGLLTEPTRGALATAQLRRHRHLVANLRGKWVCLDTCYVGQLQEVGRVWQ